MKAWPALLLFALAATASAQDVRTIQIREAQRTDERTFAYFAQFHTALVARFGADPRLSMLEWSEQEGQALVHRTADGPAEHVIFQTGKWIGTDGRQLKPWAPGADPRVAHFPLSAIDTAMLRERVRAYRAQPATAAGHLGTLKVGYFGKPFYRIVTEITVASMASFGLSVIVLDLKTGQELDVAGATADARAKREAATRK